MDTKHFSTQEQPVFTSTGITGIPGHEIGRREILNWVRNYADADTVRMLDIAGCERLDVLENEGSIFGVMDAALRLARLGAA